MILEVTTGRSTMTRLNPRASNAESDPTVKSHPVIAPDKTLIANNILTDGNYRLS